MICRSRFRAHNLCDKVQRATGHSWPASTPPSACTAPHLPSFFSAPISVRFHLKCKQLLKPPCRANNDAFKCAITISTTQTRKNCRHQLNYICIHIYTVYIQISLCAHWLAKPAARTQTLPQARYVNVLLNRLVEGSGSGNTSCSTCGRLRVLVTQAILHQYHNEGNHIGQHLLKEEKVISQKGISFSYYAYAPRTAWLHLADTDRRQCSFVDLSRD